MIHVIIQTERRTEPARMAQPVNADIRTQTGLDANGMPVYSVTPQPPQLHTMGTRIDDLSNILYAAEWNGVSPYVNVLKGKISDIKMAYLGWPMVTQAEYEAAHPQVTP